MKMIINSNVINHSNRINMRFSTKCKEDKCTQINNNKHNFIISNSNNNSGNKEVEKLINTIFEYW